jgi:hypothetical protein
MLLRWRCEDKTNRRSVRRGDKEVTVHALSSISDDCNRGGCFTLAGEQLYSDAEDDQVDPERRRGDRIGLVDPQRIWAFSFLLPYSRRVVSRQE